MSHLEQPLFISFTPNVGSEPWHHSLWLTQGKTTAEGTALRHNWRWIPRVACGNNTRQAMATYSKACASGVGRGCTHLGRLYMEGRGVPSDTKRATSIYQSGCKQRDGWSCLMLSQIYARSSPPNEHRARQQLTNATSERRASNSVRTDPGCSPALASKSATRLARPSSTSLTWGLAGGKDAKQAVRYYMFARDGGESTGCNNLGLSLLAGRGIEKDVPRGRHPPAPMRRRPQDAQARSPGRGACGAARPRRAGMEDNREAVTRLVSPHFVSPLRNRNEEPRSPPSAVGEVELPLRGAEAARNQGQRANCKVTPKAPRRPTAPMRPRPQRRQMCARATLAHRRRRAPRRRASEGGLRGDKPCRRRRRGAQRRNGYPSFLEQPLFVSHFARRSALFSSLVADSNDLSRRDAHS